MSDKFRFGNGTCTSIEVDPFRPICQKPGIDPSEAMSLEVPAPIFAPVVPPQECVCFTFAKGEAETVVKTHKVTAKSPLPKSKVAVEISPSSDDCCSGGYTITPHIEIYIPELPIPDIVVPEVCLADSTVTVKVTYPDPDAEGGKNTVTSTGGKATGGKAGKCLRYAFGELEIDLSGMPTGAFGNGGSVFKASDGDLYIDGTIDLEKDIWFGGGLGNLATDDPNAVICRGPLMMGLTSQQYEDIAGSGNHLVPHDDTKQFRLAKVGATSSSGTAIAWHSSRKTETTSGTTTTVGVNNNDTITETDMTGGTNQSVTYVGGNLSMVMPTGFQWHKRGLALNLSHFFWNDSGLLSVLEEEPYAALVSPAPVTFSDNAPAYVTNVPRAGAAAGGLRINPDKDTTLKTEPGLYIYEGDGLRIFGLDSKTPSGTDAEGADASGATAAERIGRLEVMYGPGFRIRKADSGTTPQYLDKPVDAAGALVPNDGRGLRVHGVTKKTNQWSEDQGSSGPGEESYPTSGANPDTRINELEVHVFDRDLTFQTDERLVFNDKAASHTMLLAHSHYVAADDAYKTSVCAGYRGGRCYGNAMAYIDSYSDETSDCEYTVPILVPVFTEPGGVPPEPGEYSRPGSSASNPLGGVFRPVLNYDGHAATVASLKTALETFIVMFMHVSKSGLILGIDTRPGRSGSWAPTNGIVRLADK